MQSIKASNIQKQKTEFLTEETNVVTSLTFEQTGKELPSTQKAQRKIFQIHLQPQLASTVISNPFKDGPKLR